MAEDRSNRRSGFAAGEQDRRKPRRDLTGVTSIFCGAFIGSNAKAKPPTSLTSENTCDKRTCKAYSRYGMNKFPLCGAIRTGSQGFAPEPSTVAPAERY